jgi:hypothetical protein
VHYINADDHHRAGSGELDLLRRVTETLGEQIHPEPPDLDPMSLTDHLPKGVLTDPGRSDLLKSDGCERDPAKLVSFNQNMTRVSPGFKIDSNRNFKPDFIQNFDNSYLLICNSINSK